MISYKQLKDSRSLLESAFRLLSLEPMSVLDSDLVEKEICKSYHLFASDAHGIFGTATLSERPIRTLNDSLRNNIEFQDQERYYELSLVYASPPAGLEERIQQDDAEDENLTTRYSRLFYRELCDFLRIHLNHSSLVVTTTQEESENMTFFGLWSFYDSLQEGEVFQGVLRLPTENSLILAQHHNQGQEENRGYLH